MAILKALNKKSKELKKVKLFPYPKRLRRSFTIKMHSLPCPVHIFAKF